MVEDTAQSLLAVLGNGIAWVFTPLGWGDWKAAVATITGLVAKKMWWVPLGAFRRWRGYRSRCRDLAPNRCVLYTVFRLLIPHL